jgi:hypothetical protein
VNGFERANVVGDIAVEKALRLFRERSYLGQIVTTFKGLLSEELQKSAGDLLFNSAKHPERIVSVEVKGEKKYTGNFFLEYWSNRKRLTPGWMITLRADLLCYVFNDIEHAFIVELPKLQDWAFRQETERRDFDGHIYKYRLRPQGAYEQLNDTWGRLVPIEAVQHDVGLIHWDLKAWRRVTAVDAAAPLQARLFAEDSQ